MILSNLRPRLWLCKPNSAIDDQGDDDLYLWGWTSETVVNLKKHFTTLVSHWLGNCPYYNSRIVIYSREMFIRFHLIRGGLMIVKYHVNGQMYLGLNVSSKTFEWNETNFAFLYYERGYHQKMAKIIMLPIMQLGYDISTNHRLSTS